MSDSMKKIVVVGRDADAWLTALMLQQGIRSSEQSISVELVELPSSLTPQDFFSVLPSHKIFHNILGIREKFLLKEAKGSYCFGQRFSNWAGSAPAYMHAYDRFGADFEGVDFYQFWLRGVANGLKVPLDEFNLGAVAAKQGRYIVFDGQAQTFSHAQYGYHFCAIPYIEAIAKAALALGVVHKTGTVKNVKTLDGKIASILLSNGDEVVGDFFIDASGESALLIRQLEKDNLESWADWLPADRIAVASSRPLDPLPAFSQISAFRSGWVGIYPLLDKTAMNIVYSSKFSTSTQALDTAIAISGLNISDATVSEFSAGTRKRHWIGNCLAVGSSAVSIEPLDATQLHILHVGLSLLRELLPNDSNSMPESDIYNEKINSFVKNVRDFQIAHYHLNKRFDEPYWDAVRGAEIPASLKEKIGMFAARGILPKCEDETFYQESWTSLFVGQRLQTKSYDPMVNKISDEELIQKFQGILSHIKVEVEKMPGLQAQVEMTLL